MVLDDPGPLNLAAASLPHLCCCLFLATEAIKKSYMVGMLATDSDLLFLLGPPQPTPSVNAMAIYVVQIRKYFILVDK